MSRWTMGVDPAPSLPDPRSLRPIVHAGLLPPAITLLRIPMNQARTILLFLSLSLLPLPELARGQALHREAVPSTPRGELVVEFFDVISKPQPAAWRTFVMDRYAKGFREIASLRTHIDILSGTYDRNRGFRIHSHEKLDEDRAAVLAQSELTGVWAQFIFRFADEESPQVSGISIRSGSPPAGASRGPLSLYRFYDRLDTFLGRLAEADAFSGTVVLAQDGRITFARAYGDANKRHGVKNHVDTRFSLGSMNKMFTAVGIAQLVEKGKLTFDDLLSAYLPALPTPSAARRIQIRHLLSHTSGMGDYLGELSDRQADAFEELDDFIDLVRGDTLRFVPGEKWSYSNAGFLLLGKVIETVSDTSYYAYVREHIYKPAGMSRAGSARLSAVIEDLATGYEKTYTEEGVEYRNNRFAVGVRGSSAGGGYASALDLVQFARALQSHALLSPALVETLTTAKPELGSTGYGYGFSVQSDGQVFGHSGGFTGVSANLDVFGERGLSAVVFSNYGGASGAVVRKIRRLVDRLE